MKSAAIRVVIADDEPLARERLKRLLDAETDMNVIATCQNGNEAVDAVQRLKPDLLFLDIQMPGRDGLEVARALMDQVSEDDMPVIVFVTAYDSHAVRAFETRALDYIVKPFDDERFAESLERARRQVHQGRLGSLTAQLRSLLSSAESTDNPPSEASIADPTAGRLDRIVVRVGNRARIIRADDIDWIGADGVYARLHFEGKTALIRTPMHELETRLDPASFVRIHRSTIVNLNRVSELRELDRGEYDVILTDGTRHKLSRSRRSQLEAMLGQGL